MIPVCTRCALVVKSNAYGHGIDLISTLCEQMQLADFFCVAYLSEAVHMRTIGITTPILVMTYCDENIEQAINLNIEMGVSNNDQLFLLNTVAQHLKRAIRVHIKIDTGLSRFGFMPQQIPALIAQIKASPHLQISGIYSHFAQSNAADQNYSTYQRTIFKGIVSQFFEAGIYPQHIHQQNSAAISTQKEPLYTMVRIGALAYGLWSSPLQKKLVEQEVGEESIQQVMSLKSIIIEIKEFETGTFIGYDCSFKTARDTRTAKVPIGYADGYFRYLGMCKQTVNVMVKGRLAPIIGYIAMNVITIDITDIHNAQLHDEVTLIGADPEITANALAQRIGSGNPREITTLLNPTIPRLLYEGEATLCTNADRAPTLDASSPIEHTFEP